MLGQAQTQLAKIDSITFPPPPRLSALTANLLCMPTSSVASGPQTVHPPKTPDLIALDALDLSTQRVVRLTAPLAAGSLACLACLGPPGPPCLACRAPAARPPDSPPGLGQPVKPSSRPASRAQVWLACTRLTQLRTPLDVQMFLAFPNWVASRIKTVIQCLRRKRSKAW